MSAVSASRDTQGRAAASVSVREHAHQELPGPRGRGQRDELTRTLRALEGCAIVPALNRDVVVLVTDTADEAAEQALQDALARVPACSASRWSPVSPIPSRPRPRRAEDGHDTS